MLGTLSVIGGIANIGMGIWGANQADKAAEEAREKEKRARREMKRLKNAYANLDTSNPFLNMENVFKNLTINQKQYQLQNQQFQQSQANILGNLKGAAGSSGIAALAQTLAQQGQLAAQKSAAQIGEQEARNQQMALSEDSRIQTLERQGEQYSRGLERDTVSTLLGMSQSEAAGYGEQAMAADQAKYDSISTGISGLTNIIGSFAS